MTTTLLGTQVQWPAFVLMLVEFALLAMQLYAYLARRADRQRLWYLYLLALLLLFNISNSLFPDPAWGGLRLQYITADGFAYFIGAYIPWYFYKAYGLRSLQLPATWGAAGFLLLPYVVFVILYLVNDNLAADRQCTAIVPAFYGLFMLAAMLQAIIRKYQQSGELMNFVKELAVWVAVLPWEALAAVAFQPVVQWVKLLAANLGWLMITVLQFRSTIGLYQHDEKQLQEVRESGMLRSFFEASCLKYALEEREIRLAEMIQQGLSYKEMADILNLGIKTIDNNIRALYAKVGVRNKVELIRKLWSQP
jgi:DNA-binding CsgD family transcriptional regulator